jgi:glycosyltransferase involved in cell wall biosynthesis
MTKHPVPLALIAGQLGLGGAEQQLYHLLCGLDRTRFAPIVITLGGLPGEFWEEPIRDLGIPVHYVSRTLARVGRLLRISRILAASRATIVHSWAFHANVYAAAGGTLARTPVRLGSMRESYDYLRGRAIRWVGFRGLDGVVTNCRANIEELRDVVSIPVHVVCNGVDIPNQSLGTGRAEVRARLGIPVEARVFGTIGRMDGNKNHAMLLRVFARVAAKHADARLVMIGDGPLRTELAQQANALDIARQVCFTGPVPRASQYLPAFDVFCLTSYTEGMPNVLMEAAAAGVPAVTTSCATISDVIDDGIHGFVVSIDDDARFAARVEELLASPRLMRQMGDAARCKMSRDYSIAAMASQMMDVYSDAHRAVLADKVHAAC